MKLKVQHVMDATMALTGIINARRKMSQKAKYRLARMHVKLAPEFELLSEQRNDMIKKYETNLPTGPNPEDVDKDKFIVPKDKLAEFGAAWKEIGDSEIDVDVEPLPLSLFDYDDKENGCIEADEFIALGSLITES